MRFCHRCGNSLEDDLQVHRSSTCPSCDADLRCCLNCTFYSKGAHWDCRENIDELVKEKNRSNFCGFFRFRTGGQGDGGGGTGQKARKAFDSLFGD
jgi:hypothetical protein